MMKIRQAGELSTWDSDQAEKYKAAKHGPDGAVFLDPHLYDLLNDKTLIGKKVADLGAGAGPWSEFSVREGASSVTALDFNRAMLDQVSAEFKNEINLIVADVNSLPLGNEQFDIILSINVGCNLTTLDKHFKQAFLTAEPGAKFVVTAPDSLLVSFSSDDQDIQSQIDKNWQDGMEAKTFLNDFKNVLRASFVLDDSGKPILLTKENSDLVKLGDPILRKIPGLTVDNNFHVAEEYLDAAKSAGWIVEEKHRDAFSSEEERAQYNDEAEESKKLGSSYVGNPPFMVLKLRKPE